MRGVNKSIISGNVSGKILFSNTDSGSPACSFNVASDNFLFGGQVVSVWVRVNVYGEGIVNLCKSRLSKGQYIIIFGELMNRQGPTGPLTEIRARELIFSPFDSRSETSEENGYDGSSDE